jgi:uncharacterized protein YraI
MSSSLRKLAAGVAVVAGLPAATALASHPAEEGGSGASTRGVALPAFEFRRHATVRTDRGLPVSARRAPRTSARRVLRVKDGGGVTIVCQRRGERVTGKYGTSRLWDLIAIGHGRGAYITDTYVYTGSDGRVAPRCARHSGAPGDTNQSHSHPRHGADRVIRWARRHVSWWHYKYSMTYRLPTNRTVRYMRTHQPPRGGNQGCDCSSFARWAMAQAGIAIGTYTGNIWTSNGRMSFATRDGSARTPDGRVVRGYGHRPKGGYRKGDLIFYGVSGLDKDVGHVAIYSGHGRIVQCSGSLGSNAGHSVTYNGQPTGFVRYRRLVR